MRTMIDYITSRRCWLILGVFAIVATMAALTPGTALAQNGVDASNTPFQMEGDASTTTTICFETPANGGPAIATPVNGSCPSIGTWTLVTYASGGGPSDDWDRVFNTFFGKAPGSHALATAYVNDAISSTTDNSFLGTSSALANNISTWAWKPHGVQDKDDIEHSLAAAYTLPNNDTAVYAAMDRYANNGSSIAGFVFVQDANFDLCVAAGQGASGPDKNCTAANTFVGQSTIGDLLILSAFSQGGAVSTIEVFEWDGTTMVLKETVSPAPCDPTTGSATLCGSVNNQFAMGVLHGKPALVQTNTTAPWSFSDKGGNSNFATGEFLEIGIDLNSIFGSNLPCFSKFMALTSSSATLGLTDSLSDLTAPVSFPLCGMSITKSCTGASINSDGATVHYTFGGTITNKGLAGLANVCVTDTPASSITSSNLKVNQSSYCTTGTLAGGGATTTYTGSFDATAILSTDQNTATVNATTVGGVAVDPASGTWLNGTGAKLGCAPSGAGALKLTKTCSGVSIDPKTLAITVSYTGTLTNDNSTSGGSNVSIGSIQVTDTPDGATGATNINCLDASNNVVTTLVPGASCSYSGTYVATKCEPEVDPVTGLPTTTTLGRCQFTDTANASGQGALGVGTVNAIAAQGTCSLCPLGSCSASAP